MGVYRTQAFADIGARRSCIRGKIQNCSMSAHPLVLDDDDNTNAFVLCQTKRQKLRSSPKAYSRSALGPAPVVRNPSALSAFGLDWDRCEYSLCSSSCTVSIRAVISRRMGSDISDRMILTTCLQLAVVVVHLPCLFMKNACVTGTNGQQWSRQP
eukprot:SAG31_NODE_460_length_15364_cov_11.851294_18_plen_155_part_00